jgi:hypothetical protein
MATAKKRLLSESLNGGEPIKITGTDSTSADAIHISINSTTEGTYDEVWLYVYSSHTADVDLYILYGDFDLPLTIKIPPQCGKIPIEPGIPFQDNLTIKAYASVADVLAIQGFVNQITD